MRRDKTFFFTSQVASRVLVVPGSQSWQIDSRPLRADQGPGLDPGLPGLSLLIPVHQHGSPSSQPASPATTDITAPQRGERHSTFGRVAHWPYWLTRQRARASMSPTKQGSPVDKRFWDHDRGKAIPFQAHHVPNREQTSWSFPCRVLL